MGRTLVWSTSSRKGGGGGEAEAGAEVWGQLRGSPASPGGLDSSPWTLDLTSRCFQLGDVLSSSEGASEGANFIPPGSAWNPAPGPAPSGALAKSQFTPDELFGHQESIKPSVELSPVSTGVRLLPAGLPDTSRPVPSAARTRGAEPRCAQSQGPVWLSRYTDSHGGGGRVPSSSGEVRKREEAPPHPPQTVSPDN